MNIDEIKVFVLNEFLKTIEGISDKKYQERVWIKGEGPEFDDFTETVCMFFERGDYILSDYKAYGIRDEQYNQLQKFRYAFEQFSKNKSWAPEFVDSPEWAEIMKMAKDVLNAFNFHTKQG